MAETTQPQTPLQSPAVAPAQPGEIRKLDLQVLIQDLATSQRTLFEERRHADRRLAEERERSRWEQERIRTEMGERLRDSERQNDVLIRTLGRLQAENDRLREEVAVAKSKANGHPASTPSAHVALMEAGPAPVPVPLLPKKEVSPLPGTPKLSLFSPLAPPLSGKPLPITESPGASPQA